LKNIPQGLKPVVFSAVFGTTEVVPFHETIFATSGTHSVPQGLKPMVFSVVFGTTEVVP
jgi:hypothetical protein